jgi:DNA-binding Lrp family transcriptional regulator
MSINELDQAIITALDFGERQGLAPILEKVAISPQLLDYRLRSLQKKKVILGFRPVIDSFRLGFKYFRLFLQISDSSPKRMALIASFSRSHNQVLWCYQMNGRFNLVLVFWARSLAEFEQLTIAFLARHGDVVTEYSQNQIYRLRHFSIGKFFGKKDYSSIDLEESDERIELDTLDLNILRALSNDSRQPFSAIAKRCKTSDKVVAYRIQRLEERQIIRGYRPIVNWAQLGKTHFKVFLRLDLSKKDILSRVLAKLSVTPELFFSLHGVGFPGDIDIELVLDSYQALFVYMESLRKAFPGVVRSFDQLEFTICHKVNYFPL